MFGGHSKVTEIYGYGFAIRGYGYFNSPLASCIYSAIYGQYFPILITHFIYRTLSLER